MINASIDMLGAYGQTLAASQRVGQLPTCFTLRLMPLYCLAMLKYVSFYCLVEMGEKMNRNIEKHFAMLLVNRCSASTMYEVLL